jgi:polyhydroxybutyrate depolymerase
MIDLGSVSRNVLPTTDLVKADLVSLVGSSQILGATMRSSKHVIRFFFIGLILAQIVGAQITIDLGRGRGPVTVHVPSSYEAGSPTAVVMLLHGYTSSGQETEAYLQLLPLAEQLGFFYLYPNGTSDFLGNNFWNATDGCCNFFGSSEDDSAYLRALLDEVAAQLTVDPERVFILGHSNGGFMAHRMACDHAGFIRAIVSVAGATYSDPADCVPQAPVRVLQIHGTADGTIAFEGGSTPSGPYPGAVETVETWAEKNGCTLKPDTSLPAIDLEGALAGPETDISLYADGCAPGGVVELWTIQGGEHVPVLSVNFHTLVGDFLFGADGPTVFKDGFEAGDLGAWSATTKVP